VRTLVLLAFAATAGHAEIIHYYLHDATIGADPNHAVNAPVTGIFDFDTTARLFTFDSFSFLDLGLAGVVNYPAFSSYLVLRDGTSSATAVTFATSTPSEKYPLVNGQIAFDPTLGAPTVALNLADSFVRIYECPVPAPGGCPTTTYKLATLNFTAGHISTLQTEPPIHNPEPSTLILSATCVSLCAWRRRRSCARP
jgi:hypothetical protein